jgi:hypothetical protein
LSTKPSSEKPKADPNMNVIEVPAIAVKMLTLPLRGSASGLTLGQKYYSQTIISAAKGERYFCSEWEAWFAGWSRSKVLEGVTAKVGFFALGTFRSSAGWWPAKPASPSG